MPFLPAKVASGLANRGLRVRAATVRAGPWLGCGGAGPRVAAGPSAEPPMQGSSDVHGWALRACRH